MLSDADRANQREVKRKIKELGNLLHDLGKTKRGSRQFASAELAHAYTRLREGALWVDEHYKVNVIDPALAAAREKGELPPRGQHNNGNSSRFRRAPVEG